MSIRPDKSLKEVADRLAQLITNGETQGKEVEALKQQLYRAAVPGEQTSPVGSTEENASESPQRIGIWTRKVENGKEYYVRDNAFKKEFYSWSRVDKIPPKSSRKRIVYLGESVSLGFLLYPFYTPSSVLETVLNSGLPAAEVIDLSRHDCSIELLTELLASCMALKPDVLVIFAGNNWMNKFGFSPPLFEEVTAAMESVERFDASAGILEKQYKNMIGAFMKHVNDLSTRYGVPVINVVPEFNLLDFKSNPVQRINSWPKGETGQWLELKEKSEELMDNGDAAGAEPLIREMIALNRGNPLGYEMLAQCKLASGLNHDATRCLRDALDTAIFHQRNAPGAISVISAALRDESARYNMSLVDLPRVFEARLKGKPPGRDLFLDYCHMTDHGIRIAMAAVAQPIFEILSAGAPTISQLEAAAPHPDKEVLSRAHFFAAVHNAHRGEQPYELLYYHCLQALKADSDIKDLMINYIEMATAHTAWTLNKNCERLFESGAMEQFPYMVQPYNHDLMDIDLVDAAVDALKQYGVDVQERISELRKEEHGLQKGEVDLLESYYHLASYTATYRPDDSHYRAFDVQSEFYLVAGGNSGASLDITYRLPRQSGKEGKEENVTIKINGTIAARLPAVDRWRDDSVAVPAKLLSDGVNRVTVTWPAHVDYKESRHDIPAGVRGLDLLKRMMYPPYGEIHRFTAHSE